jgi:Spy/CpxP family protein refolding chaperone
VAALVVVFAASAVSAFDLSSLSSDQTKKLTDELTRFKNDLALSPEQVSKMKPILGEQMSQLQELKSSPGLSKQDKIAKFNDIRKAGYEQIKQVLTPEQLTKWDAEMAKAKKFLGSKVPH